MRLAEDNARSAEERAQTEAKQQVIIMYFLSYNWTYSVDLNLVIFMVDLFYIFYTLNSA